MHSGVGARSVFAGSEQPARPMGCIRKGTRSRSQMRLGADVQEHVLQVSNGGPSDVAVMTPSGRERYSIIFAW